MAHNILYQCNGSTINQNIVLGDAPTARVTTYLSRIPFSESQGLADMENVYFSKLFEWRFISL